MVDENGNERIINVKVCKRIGGNDPILVCARCGNEVESKPNAAYWLDGLAGETATKVPRHNYCPWCSAPLKEEP